MIRDHIYKTIIEWTGNTGKGTETYKDYKRDHILSVQEKMFIELSSDTMYRGDALKYNPEELLLASLSSCHMLWYLHLCAENGIAVMSYIDHATGIMQTGEDGSGRFTSVTLQPEIEIKNSNKIDMAYALHAEANKMCFIANSVNFHVAHLPKIRQTEK